MWSLTNCNGNFILCKSLFQQPRGSTCTSEDLAGGLPSLYRLCAMDAGPALSPGAPVAAVVFWSVPSATLVQLWGCTKCGGFGLHFCLVWRLWRESNYTVWQADLEILRQEGKLGESTHNSHLFVVDSLRGKEKKKKNMKSDNAFLWNHFSEKSCSLISVIVCCSDLSCCRLSAKVFGKHS